MMRRLSALTAWTFGLATFVGFVACVGDDPTTPSSASSGGDDASTSADGVSPSGDGSATADGASSTTDSGVVCPAGDTACGTTCINLQAADDNNCGRCGRSCLGDGCVKGVCNSVDLYSTLTSPTTVGTTDNTDQVVVNTNGQLVRIPKIGGSPTALWTSSTFISENNSAFTITSDSANKEAVSGIVYMSTATFTPLYMQLQIQATPPSAPGYFNMKAGVSGAINLASDDQAVGGDVALQSLTMIVGCPLGHCTPASPSYATTGNYMAVAIQHGVPGSVLWTDTLANIQYCARGSADAGVCTPTKLLATNPADATPTKFLFVTSTKVFWVVSGTTHFRVLSCPFPGPCASPKVLVDNEHGIDSFTADDNGMYWVQSDTGLVRQCLDTTAGCGSTTSSNVLTGLVNPVTLTMDSKYVYIVQSPSTPGQGKLTRVAR